MSLLWSETDLYGVMSVISVFLCVWSLFNVLTFAFYGIDKYKSKHKRQRISERTLLWFAFMGGSAGAWAGMLMFRHKTLHLRFRILVPLFFFLQLLTAGVFLWLYGGAHNLQQIYF